MNPHARPFKPIRNRLTKRYNLTAPTPTADDHFARHQRCRDIGRDITHAERDIKYDITCAGWRVPQRIRGVPVHLRTYTFLYFDGHGSAHLHSQDIANPCVAGKMGNIIERAITLALSGQHTTIRTIRAELHTEGFTHRELASLSGRELQRQLRALMTRTETTTSV